MPSASTPCLLKRLGIARPILQAPMAGAQDHRLAVAVARAGGLGALPAAALTADALVEEIRRFRQAADAPLNLNFFCHRPPRPDAEALERWHARLRPLYAREGLDPSHIPTGAGRQPLDESGLAVLRAHRPEVVSFHFGLPEPALLDAVKATGAVVLSTATTVAEARWLQAHGADAVIAQGLEAGGHRGHFLCDDLALQSGLIALLPQVVAAVSLPVIAAGGIATAAAVSACQALGASAVQIGTALLLAPEATPSAVHRAALRRAAERPTELTRLFTGRPARGLRNGLMRDLDPLHPDAPAFPLATAALAPLRQHAEAQGRDDYTPLWAGQAAALASPAPAADTVHALAAGWR